MQAGPSAQAVLRRTQAYPYFYKVAQFNSIQLQGALQTTKQARGSR